MPHTNCQVCQIHCTLLARPDGQGDLRITGDKDDPAYHGYSCIKGREMTVVHELPSRLRHSMKRNAAGEYEPIGSGAVLDEVAGRLAEIVARHGPRSVALFMGTYGTCNLVGNGFAQALMRAIGSPMIFTPQTIDQPGKAIGMALHGPWLGGTPPLREWDALLLIGVNPLVSMNGGLGPNPARNLKQARERGMKLVVIDPRVSDTARHADLHIQGRPGEDAAIMAGIARELIVRDLFDTDFVQRETEGFEALKAAVMPFDAETVARRAGIPTEQIREAATILGAARKGAVSAGTGANMSGSSTTCEYLVLALTSLRGWWLRAGEQRPNPGVLIDPPPPIAASPGPFPVHPTENRMRVRGLRETIINMPCAALAEEILLPGEGQIKALITLGGNPIVAFPDQLRTEAAMDALDLLVCIDPRMGQTARRAHYVIAPKLQLEVETNSAANEFWGALGGPGWGYDIPYAVACPPVIEPPAGSDLIEEWEAILGIAQRMGHPLWVRSFAIRDPARAAAEAVEVGIIDRPDALDAWEIVLKGSPVPYRELRRSPGGRLFERETLIQPRPKGWAGKLMIGAEPIVEHLGELASEHRCDGEHAFTMISRRLHDIHNSNWHDSPRQAGRQRYNPAYMNPADLLELGASPGDRLEIVAKGGKVVAIADVDEGVRRGCVSISHGWGRNSDEDEDPYVDGTNISRLTVSDSDFDPVTGMPRLSAIPVSIRRASAAAASIGAGS